MSLDELSRIANMMPELIYIIKFFGTIIVSLLSVIAVMGGVIWNNIRKEIKVNKDDAITALREQDEAERVAAQGVIEGAGTDVLELTLKRT